MPWHQDAQYWPLEPANAVTVWLAVYDSDEENGAMKVVSGSHKKGANGFKHHTNDASHLVLDQEVSEDQIDKDKIVPEAHVFDDLNFDSLDSVQVVLEIEKEFDIEATDEEIDDIQTVQDIIDLVENLS